MSTKDWELISFVYSSKIRKIILNLLKMTPKTPKMLSMETDFHLSHISRALTELQNKDLIICNNPQSRKGKFFSITPKGREILEDVIDLEIKKNDL